MLSDRQRQQFGARLRALRDASSYSQGDVADQLGITRGAYAQWERGIRVPNVEQLIRLATVYDLTDEQAGRLLRSLDD